MTAMIILHHLLWIATIWAASLLMGAVSIPVAAKLFTKSPDRGYAMAKILGWIAVGYGLVLATTARILPLSTTSVAIVLVCWIALNAFIVIRARRRDARYAFGNLFAWKRILGTEVGFLALLAAFTIVKGFQPEIYQIERFMDFGFIETLRNSTSLPLEDLWFQGETLNYYYFGHIIAYVILAVTRIETVPGFALIGGWMFASAGVAIAQLGAWIFREAFDNHTEKNESNDQNGKAAARAAGILSVFSVLFAGTWLMVPWFVKQLRFVLSGGEEPFIHYPLPTRIIPGTITEMPFYSFLVADLHAHVWGILVGILVLATLFGFWKSAEKLSIKNVHLLALTGLLGIAYMTNSWDTITLGAFVVTGVAVRSWKRERYTTIALTIAAMPVLAYAVALPWSIFFEAPIAGLGYVHTRSPLWPWISFWGGFVVVAVAYFTRLLFVNRSEPNGNHTNRQAFAITAVAMAFIFIALLEFVHMKDILIAGEWFRANTVFKVTTQAWLWLGVMAGPILVWLIRSQRTRRAQTMASVLIAVALMVQALYPIEATRQAMIAGRSWVGVQAGLEWWKQKFPNDYAAYEYLNTVRNTLPARERKKHLIEADGDSYTDVSRFSVFLGWPSVVGWPVHEWTWRGSYDEVGARREEVREIYLGDSLEEKRAIMAKYETDYIILGEVERNTYGVALREDLVNELGTIVFEQESTKIIKVR